MPSIVASPTKEQKLIEIHWNPLKSTIKPNTWTLRKLDQLRNQKIIGNPVKLALKPHGFLPSSSLPSIIFNPNPPRNRRSSPSVFCPGAMRVSGCCAWHRATASSAPSCGRAVRTCEVPHRRRWPAPWTTENVGFSHGKIRISPEKMWVYMGKMP